MRLAVSLFIGLRYIISKRSSGFLSFISIFSMGGMALGVFALVVVLSVMNGFDHELKSRLLRAIPHAVITETSGTDDWQALQQTLEPSEGLMASSPYVGGSVLLTNDGPVRGAQVQGVLPESDRSVSPVGQYMVSGEFDALQPGEFGIVLGRILANSLGTYVGDDIRLTLPKLSVTLAGVFPRSRRFKVVGIFEVGAQVDQQLALIHINDAQKLFRLGNAVDGLRLKFDDFYQVPSYVSSMASELNEQYSFTDWSQTQGSLFRAVKLEKTVTGLLLGIIILVAAFNIVTGLIMMVTEKRSDIAVLRTMGMSRLQVLQIFVTQGFVTALVGVFLGLLFGVPVAIYLPEIMAFFEAAFGLQVFDPSVYFVAQIPSRWILSDTLYVGFFALICAFLSSIFPAYRASQILPAEAMRYNN